jgi:hypothetical protein
MGRLFLVPCLITGLLLCGCSSRQATDTNWAHQPPNPVDGPPLPTSSEWIGAGAVATTGEPPAPPSSRAEDAAPKKEKTWMAKGMHVVGETIRRTCEFSMGVLVLSAALSVIVLYYAAAGNTVG